MRHDVEASASVSERAEAEMRGSQVHLSRSHPAILRYTALQSFVTEVQQACISAEDGTLAVVSFLQSIQRKTWTMIQEVLSKYVCLWCRWLVLLNALRAVTFRRPLRH
jgi:hypothetical protein